MRYLTLAAVAALAVAATFAMTPAKADMGGPLVNDQGQCRQYGPNNTNLITETVLNASHETTRNLHQTYDFSALFHGDAFQAYAEPAASSDVVSAVDPAALTSVDPAAAGLDATPLLDMFPHLEAAVNFLTGLF